jgi:hypothetical protein
VKKSITSVSSGKKASCSNPTGYHGEVSWLNSSLVSTDTQFDRPSHHPNKLLMRMIVSGDMRARLHSPIGHRALFAGYDAAADLSVICSLGTDASLSNPKPAYASPVMTVVNRDSRGGR